MKKISVKPDKKYFTKQIYVLFTVSFFIALFSLILQILIPLAGKVTHSELASYLWPISWLWITNLEYFIEDERITIHKGIISKIQQNIPYRAVTDFMLHRSLFDRMLGIGSLRVQTAGQSINATGYEGYLSGIVNYDELLTELRRRVRKYNEIYGYEDEDADENEPKRKSEFTEMLIELRKIRELLENQRR